jgi:hypothetical protein
MRRQVEPVEDAPPQILFVEPEDGSTGVFLDTPVALRASVPLDPLSVGPESLRVHDDTGRVPGVARVLADACVVLWRASRPLRPQTIHFVVVDGLRDRRGRALAPHWSRFVPCGIGREDL